MPSFHDKEISSLTRTGLRANSLPSQHDDHKYALRVIKYTKPSYLQNKKSLKVNWKRKLFSLFQSRSVSSSQMLDPSLEYLSWNKEVLKSSKRSSFFLFFIISALIMMNSSIHLQMNECFMSSVMHKLVQMTFDWKCTFLTHNYSNSVWLLWALIMCWL